jgi:drug/metabolite transporter (DMT)-like permease
MHQNLLIGALILSQLTLGIYSYVIKTIPANLSTQVLARASIFTILAAVAGYASGQPVMPSLSHLLTMGPLNVINIASSYYAYTHLPTMVSIPLLYIYPFINVFLSSVLLNSTVNLWSIPWLILSFIGVLTIIMHKGKLSHNIWAIGAILIAAVTESLIYISFKSGYHLNQFHGLFHLYAGSLIAVLAAGATNLIAPFDFSPSLWIPLTFFIAFIGFLGIVVETYAIPLLSVELFSALAFFAVISAYIFSHFCSEGTPSLKTVIGATLIITGAVAVRYISEKPT